MHTHRVEIFDRADDHHVVAQIAHHLQLKFFPAKYRGFNKDFVIRAGIERPFDVSIKFFLVIGDASTGAAQREGGPNDQWEPQRAGDSLCLTM